MGLAMSSMGWIVAGAVLLPGPAFAQASPAVISYETTECFGYCPVYRITVNPDGSALFEGRRHTAVHGLRRFRMTRAQASAFARRLAPFRPARGRISYDPDTRCRGAGAAITDASSINVTWQGPRGRQSLHFYGGCPNQPIRSALTAAPRLIPVGAFIGPPCRSNCRR
jgi:hypothetical protein